MVERRPRLVGRVAAASAVAASLGGAVAVVFAGLVAGGLVGAHEDAAVLAAAAELADEVEDELDDDIDDDDDDDDDDAPMRAPTTLEEALRHELDDVDHPDASAAVVADGRTIAGDASLRPVPVGTCVSTDEAEQSRRVCAAPMSDGGVVLLAVSAKGERERWTLFAWALCCGALVGAAVGGALSWRAARWALSPLTELRDRVRRIDVAAPGSAPLEPAMRHVEMEELRGAIAQLVDRLAVSLEHATSFSARAAHELRTPLALLAGELELMLEDENRSPEDREALRRLHRSVQDLVSLAQRLLILAHPGHAPAEAGEAVDLADVVDAVRSGLAKEQRDRVHVDAAPDLLVRGDFELLRSLVHNAVDNALKFSEHEVRVSVGVDDAHVVIDVRDRGPGIAPDELAHVFDAFYRSPRAAMPGHGVGLALVAHVAEAHNGTAEFVPSTEGAHLRVRLPRW